MDRKTRQVFWLVVSLVWMLFVLGGCIEREPIEEKGTPLVENKPEVKEDLRAYFPAQAGMTYRFAGEGNEYASFTRSVKYVKQPYVQVYDNNGGTVSVRVYALQKDQIVQVFSQEEFYEEKNILDQIGKDKVPEEVILKSPLQAGTSWESSEWRREIVDVDATVTVPAGTFYHAVKVKMTSKRKENTMTSFDYFAANVGLILREYIGEGIEITSKLESYGFSNAKVDSTAPPAESAPTGAQGLGARDQAITGNTAQRPDKDQETFAVMQNPDLPLLAYQMEHQLRAAFRAAYESYVNLTHISPKQSKKMDQILTLYRLDIQNLATDAMVNEQLNRLKEYYEAGQEGVSFPTSEVVQAARLLSRTTKTAKIGITVQKYYPDQDWSGRSVDRRGDYIVELTQMGQTWKIASVEEAD